VKIINSWAFYLKQIRWILISIAIVTVLIVGRVAFNIAHQTLPAFTVDKSSIHFFSGPDQSTTGKEISFYSDGSWTATVNAPGITVSPTRGKASKKPIVLDLTINTNGLNAGTYEGSIVISKANSANSAAIPVILYVTDVGVGESVDIPVTVDASAAVAIMQASVTIGVLTGPDYFLGNVVYNAGDFSLEVSGVFRNDSPNEFISYWAVGYGADGKQIAQTISSGAIFGQASVAIAPGETGDFNITLNWAPGVKKIVVFAYADANQPP